MNIWNVGVMVLPFPVYPKVQLAALPDNLIRQLGLEIVRGQVSLLRRQSERRGIHDLGPPR